MAIIMGVVVIVLFISGFLSLYTRQCAYQRRTRTRIRGRLDLAFPIGSTRRTSHTQPRGVDPDVIRTFPTFLYCTVKDRGTLACAVCLNEYEDDETLRLIPKCSHVFHPDCINAWLASHSTCPVCRANLLLPVPAQGDTRFVGLHIPDAAQNEGSVGESNNNDNHDRNTESPKVNLLSRSGTRNQNRCPSRSRSTGFLMAILFPRSQWMGHTDTVVEPGEDWDRFTLRLEELNSSSTLKRTKSCVTFTRMSSGRKGYRTRSVASARGRNYLLYELLANNPPLHLMYESEASSHCVCPS